MIIYPSIELDNENYVDVTLFDDTLELEFDMGEYQGFQVELTKSQVDNLIAVLSKASKEMET